MGRPMTTTEFQKFRRSDLRSAGAPLVAIHKRKLFALDQSAWERLGSPEAVELYYSAKGRGVIGFKGASRNSPDSYVVRHHTKYSHQVEGRAFFRFYEIPDEVTGRRYRAEMAGDVLTVDLNQDSDEDEE